ncbi:hypothetical protein EG812_13130 [Verrucosispora sp. FIM060022]|nr:hypothetical protein EG812_13130 [Verrucosispora sp. FIM060022]
MGWARSGWGGWGGGVRWVTLRGWGGGVWGVVGVAGGGWRAWTCGRGGGVEDCGGRRLQNP